MAVLCLESKKNLEHFHTYTNIQSRENSTSFCEHTLISKPFKNYFSSI